MAEDDRRRAGEANEGFLRRWSRRKAQARSATADTPDATREESVASVESASASPRDAPGQAAPAPVDPETLPDIETLTADSDFSVFMRPGVPAHLRSQALRKLWRSDPIFSHLDGLVEYGEDYTLPSWPQGAIKTAYQVGRGFVNELEKLAEREPEWAKKTALPEVPSDAAPSIGTTVEPPATALAESRHGAPEAAGSEEGEAAAQSAPGPARAKARMRRGRRPLPRRG